MLTKHLSSLASLLLVVAPLGCSKNEPATEAVAPPPVVTIDAAPATAHSVDPSVKPASAEPASLGEMAVDNANQVAKKADADVREVSEQIQGQAKQTVSEVQGQANQAVGEIKDSANKAKADARKMIDRAKRSAADRAKAVKGEIKKEAGEMIDGLLGDPKN